MHSAQGFYVETQFGKKPQNAFLILCKYYIQFTSTNSMEAPTPCIF